MYDLYARQTLLHELHRLRPPKVSKPVTVRHCYFCATRHNITESRGGNAQCRGLPVHLTRKPYSEMVMRLSRPRSEAPTLRNVWAKKTKPRRAFLLRQSESQLEKSKTKTRYPIDEKYISKLPCPSCQLPAIFHTISCLCTPSTTIQTTPSRLEPHSSYVGSVYMGQSSTNSQCTL